MSDDIYNRQKTINLNSNIKVIVSGVGGIGYNFVIQLAMSGVKDIYMFDPDVIEASNLNRLPIPFSFIGKNKADCAKLMVEQMRNDVNIMSFPYKFSERMLPSNMTFDWFVDCTDIFETQLINQEFAKANNMKYVKLGYDGERIGIHDKIGMWNDGEPEVDGYTVTPSWVVPANIVAGMAVAKIMKYPQHEMSCEISDFFNFKH